MENKNHQIDDIVVTSAQQLFILVHRGLAEQRETSIQIYHYVMEKDEERGEDNEFKSSFHGHRIQQFNTPFDLYKPYLYYSNGNGDLYLDICKPVIMNASNLTDDFDDAVCRSYTWTTVTGGGADFRPILEPSPVDKWLQTTSIADKSGISNFKMDMGVVFLRNKVIFRKKNLNKLVFILSLNCAHRMKFWHLFGHPRISFRIPITQICQFHVRQTPLFTCPY